jgi:hypothetical protein
MSKPIDLTRCQALNRHIIYSSSVYALARGTATNGTVELFVNGSRRESLVVVDRKYLSEKHLWKINDLRQWAATPESGIGS